MIKIVPILKKRSIGIGARQRLPFWIDRVPMNRFACGFCLPVVHVLGRVLVGEKMFFFRVVCQTFGPWASTRQASTRHDSNELIALCHLKTQPLDSSGGRLCQHSFLRFNILAL